MRVKLLGKKWLLKLVPYGSPALKIFNGDDDEVAGYNVFGLCDVSSCTMTVANDVDPQQIADTVWHEITHAVDETLGLKLSESQVHAIAAGQLAVLLDNPKLIDLLLQK